MLTDILRCAALPWTAPLTFKKIFPRWLKQPLSAAERDRYAVTVVYYATSFRLRWHEEHRIWWDSPLGVVLWRDERAIACAGFRLEKTDLVIEQLQGVRGCFEELKPVRWERMLVALLTAEAQRIRCRNVAIVPGRWNRYYNYLTNAADYKLRYDVTARRMGFALNSAGDLWMLTL